MEKIDKKNIEDILALNPMQEGMLFHYLKDPEMDYYFEQLCLDISGKIDFPLFEQAWNRVIESNEMLRTLFRWEKMKAPSQIILKQYRLKPAYIDLSNKKCLQEENALEEVKKNDRKKKFDLARIPFRVTLCKLGEDKFGMIISNHHILYDGWSNGIILREFFETYNALLRGDEFLQLPPPVKTKFKEYVKWIVEQDKDEQKEYWVDYLKGLERGTRFPAMGHNREHTTGNLYHASFPKKITRQLQAFVKESKLTTASLLYSSWGILLQRYTDNDDVLFGTTVSGRSAKIRDIENMVGLFIQTPPLRVMLRPGEKVINLVQRIKETLQRREAYECTPLVDINKYNRVAQDEELYNTIVVIENYPLDRGLARGNLSQRLTLQSYSLVGHTNYDLAIGILIGDDRHIEVTFNWQTQLMDTKRVKRLWTHFTRIIESMAANPGQQAEAIDMVTEEEKSRLLYSFNHTETAYPVDKTIHQLFEEQVQKTPDHTALAGQSLGAISELPQLQITYKKLNEKSNQLAYQLRWEGIKVGAIVGILLESSIERVVAMVAILKAGGGYLPIDPGLPLSRIVSILEDCDAPILLTNTTAAGKNSFALLKSLGLVRTAARVTGLRPQLTKLDDLPIPDRSLVNYDKYMNRMGQAWVKHSMALLATRGCPYKCAYCQKVWPDKYVVRSAENIFHEVTLYYQMGVRRFVIVDDIFNMDIKNSSRFFQLLIERGLDVQLFFPSGMRGDLLTRDYIDLMVRAGVVSVALALETASPRLQKMIGKHINIKKFRENLEYLCDTYPHVITELFTMHGFPTETEKEAMMTLDFIKSIKGIHFPYINILRIYSNTDMYRMAVENGISPQAIFNSENLYFHEIPETLPFEKNFTRKYQADFLNRYFLSRERLLQVLSYQMKLLTEDEIIRKYNGYLEVEISCFDDLLQLAGISRDDLRVFNFQDETAVAVPHLHDKIKAHFSSPEPGENALKVLFLDLSQFFSIETNRLDNIYDAPLGMMYVMSYMNHRLGTRVKGRIAKSRVDFDNFRELKVLIEEFKPDIIGLRALTYYRDHFHRTAALIRHWGFDVPIVTGGPYATSSFNTLLQDRNIDLVVLGEGEVTFTALIEKMLENEKQFPGKEVLNEIPGLAFIPDRPGGFTGKARLMAEANVYSREIIMLDQIRERLQRNPGTNLTTANESHHPAYIMFTSGSTGKPKGVIIEHKNVINNLYWFGKTFAIEPGTHLLQMSDYTFDPSVEDIFGSLVHGATLYLSDRDLILDRERFRRFIKENLIHIIDHVPAMLDELLGTGEPLQSLRVVISGGMRLEEAVKERLIEKGYPLYNNYGPTEVTVDALCGLCSQEPVTLGKPIFNTKCYIIDSHHRFVPMGVAGELCVAGEGVSRGYLNNPELTEERFKRAVIRHSSFVISSTLKTNNQWSMNHDRFYKTGDLARWLPDGNIEFISRVDTQVKIRGNRVELKEIEEQLRNHEKIKEVVVTSRGKDGDIYLCAYVVLLSPGVLTTGDMKDYLSRYLPEYMIPAYFVPLSAFPLTPGGKVDTRALPEPGKKAGESYLAPRNETEKKLVDIWSEVLQIEPEHIGINDEFFSLGGHSINAFRLISKIHKKMNVKISITEVFNHPVIMELAEYITRAEKNIFSSIQSVEKREYYPLSTAQKRLYITCYSEVEGVGYNVQNLVEIQGKLSRERLEKTFIKLIARHESLRTSFLVISDEPVQRVHDRVEFEIEYDEVQVTGAGDRCRWEKVPFRQVSDTLGKDLATEYTESTKGTRGLAPLTIEPATSTLKDFIRPFDLSKAPLLRVGLIKLLHTPTALRGHPSQEGKKDTYLLMVDMHHIIADAFSMGLFIHQFKAIYREEVLPPLKIQYKEFALWQAELTGNPQALEALGRQENYWLKELEGEVPLLNLPLDFPRPTLEQYEGAVVFFELDKAAAALLKNMAREVDVTLFMLFLAAFNVLLSKICDQEDILVGTPVVGRGHADLQQVIGLFINMLVLKNQPYGSKTFRGFLKEIKKKTLAAYENQDYPYEELVDQLSIKRNPGRNPLFDVILVWEDLDMELGELENTGIDEKKLKLKLFKYNKINAPFDLVLNGTETNEKMSFFINYRTSLFKRETINQITWNFKEIISGLLKEPDIKLEDIAVSYNLLEAKPAGLLEDQGDFGF